MSTRKPGDPEPRFPSKHCNEPWWQGTRPQLPRPNNQQQSTHINITNNNTIFYLLYNTLLSISIHNTISISISISISMHRHYVLHRITHHWSIYVLVLLVLHNNITYLSTILLLLSLLVSSLQFEGIWGIQLHQTYASWILTDETEIETWTWGLRDYVVIPTQVHYAMRHITYT